MPASLSLMGYRTSPAMPWMGRVLLAVFVASLMAVCGLLVVYGPKMRAAAEANEVRIIEQEDRAFCGKLGIGPGAERYAECSAGLKEIRKRYLERNVSDSIL